MAKFSPADAVFSGFRFARAQPAAVLIWAAYWLAAATIASLALFNLGGDSMNSLIAAVQSPHPNADQVANLMSDLAPASGFALLLMLVSGSVLLTAVLRVRLLPGPHAWAGLRLGGEELKLLAVMLALLAVTLGAETLVIVVARLVASASEAAGAVAMIVGYGLIVGLNVRLSLAPVATLVENRISLPRAFALTRGRFWPLLGAYLFLAVIMLVILGLVMILFGALMTAAAAAGAGGVPQLLFALQHNVQDINPLLLGLYVLMNFAQVWVAIVGLAAGVGVASEAYKTFASEQPQP